MIISLIVAMDQAGGIGKENQLPWHIRSDLKRFKALTMGHHIVMGRVTYETIGRPLPGRVTIVLSHRKRYHLEGCQVVDSLEAAIQLAKVNHETELFIIGGGSVFEQAIPIADKIYLTTVHARVKADVFFSSMLQSEWKLVHTEEPTPDEHDEYGSDFKVFTRRNAEQA